MKQVNIFNVPAMLLLNFAWNSTMNTNTKSHSLFCLIHFTHTRLNSRLQHSPKETILEQIERVPISLKNVFGIICRKRQILYQITCWPASTPIAKKDLRLLWNIIWKINTLWNVKTRVVTFVNVIHVMICELFTLNHYLHITPLWILRFNSTP